MKVALVFAGNSAATSTFMPYRSTDFIRALAAVGVETVLVDLDLREQSRFPPPLSGAPGTSYYRNQADRLPLIAAQERAALIQTFGGTLDLAPVWREAAKTQAAIMHFVSSEGGVAGPQPPRRFALADGAPASRLVAALQARFASRCVAGVLGSNRADLGRHMRQGFFPRAQFSMIAPPPVTLPTNGAGASSRQAGERPAFGYYDPEASESSLQVVCRALDLTTSPELFDMRIAPARLSRLAPERAARIDFVEAADAAAFVRDIDVLIVPEAHDRALATVAAALAARRIVIVPDTGAVTELVEYGRHGVLHAPGSAYHLAMALNVMAQSWSNRPISFDGVEATLARTAPDAVAGMFAAAYRRIAG